MGESLSFLHCGSREVLVGSGRIYRAKSCSGRVRLDNLEITKGPRGTIGLPRFLREVVKAQKQLEAQTKENES